MKKLHWILTIVLSLLILLGINFLIEHTILFLLALLLACGVLVVILIGLFSYEIVGLGILKYKEKYGKESR